MSGRLVQLKLVDRSAAVTAKAALVLQVAGENVSIENGALVRASSHRAWTAFQVSTAIQKYGACSLGLTCAPSPPSQDASRRLLGAKDVLIFRVEGSRRPLCSVLTLLGQPSNMVCVLVSQVPRDPLPASTHNPSASPSSNHHQQQQEGAAELDGVLRRTQEICRSLVSPRSRGAHSATPVSAILRPLADGRATRSLDSLTPRSPFSRLSWTGRSSSAACPSVPPHGLDECDLEVERLLQLSDSLTQLDAEGAYHAAHVPGVLQDPCMHSLLHAHKRKSESVC